MRLIDADALKEVFKEKGSEAVCGVELCKAIISQIDNQPTVETIPVEFIKSEIKENKGFYNSNLRRLLDVWAERKEE